MRLSALISGLPFRENPLFDTKTAEGVINPTLPFHISFLIHNRRSHWKRGRLAHETAPSQIPAKVARRQISRIESWKREWYMC
jgi:hypothetical protein